MPDALYERVHRRVLLVAPRVAGALGDFLAEGFRTLGHEVEWFDYRRASRFGKAGLGPLSGRVVRAFEDVGWARAGRGLLAAADKTRPDLVLVLKGEAIPAETIRMLVRDRGLPTFVWHLDLPWGPKSNSNVHEAVKYYTACFTPDTWHEPLYRRVGAQRVVFLPFACDPGVHRPMDLTPAERKTWASDVAYVGNARPPDSALARALELIVDSKVRLRVWGDVWDARRTPGIARALEGRGAHGADLARALSACKVAFNLTDDQAMNAVNMRVFEATACGAFTLTDAQGDLPKLFTAGRELATYGRIEEIPDLLRTYLADEAARTRIAAEGRKRALAEHTYAKRAEVILREIA